MRLVLLTVVAVQFATSVLGGYLFTQARENRHLIANSDLTLCRKIYGEIVAATKRADKQTTVQFYEQILPNIDRQVIVNLVARGHRNAQAQEREFAVDQCSQLPSQHLKSR